MASKMISVPCTLFWCNPNRKDNYGFISGTFGLLDDNAVKTLKDAGLKIKFDTENDPEDDNFMGFFLKARSQEASVPCRDTEGNVVPPTLFLGNGSKATVIIEAREWKSDTHASAGIKAVFRGVKIKELVVYDPDAASKAKAEAMLDADTSGGGFVFGESTEDSDENTDTPAVNNEEFDRLFGETA